MANVITSQVLEDGNRNCTIRVVCTLDTSDLASQTLIDPATIGPINSNNNVKATLLRMDNINYDIEDGLNVYLTWDAGTPVRFANLYGRGEIPGKGYGGIQNNATAPTGKILITTQGYAVGDIATFTLILQMVKQ